MTTEPLACVDPYTGLSAACEPDPCSPDGTTTLYHVMPCTADNPPMGEWCVARTDHPACAGVTSEVGVAPELPDTGLSNAGGAGLAAVVMLTLGWALLKVSEL